jgi:hypothetical protein
MAMNGLKRKSSDHAYLRYDWNAPASQVDVVVSWGEDTWPLRVGIVGDPHQLYVLKSCHRSIAQAAECSFRLTVPFSFVGLRAIFSRLRWT